MKKFLSIILISLLIFGACSPKEETNIETTEELPVNADNDMSADTELKEETNIDENKEAEIVEEVAPETEVIEEDSESSGLLELTLDELKAYDGTNGNPAYIAIDGKIYDVTDIPNWNGGNHNGFKAGNDLTKEMKEISPHGVSKLQLVEEVGIIVE